MWFRKSLPLRLQLKDHYPFSVTDEHWWPQTLLNTGFASSYSNVDTVHEMRWEEAFALTSKPHFTQMQRHLQLNKLNF